ncbi:hypothetical protein FRAAL4886 [Frankia alni ACN14a]|uniref:Uncharacterized protein n=1 Tax=Frankia alni (strain DSM 45986 / CECT 9034 / ACN14a) TaxID=326424 RepID=Q0RG62_FRAAA|nr:hypothetical protein FRAAL4886 [Frankia alni ACN14a]
MRVAGILGTPPGPSDGVRGPMTAAIVLRLQLESPAPAVRQPVSIVEECPLRLVQDCAR